MLVTNRRTRGNEKPFEPLIYKRKLSQALEQLLVYELGCGGQIINLKENEVTIMTRVMNCIDITTFEWDNNENAVVYDVISTSVAVKKLSESKPIQDVLIDKVMEITRGIPLRIKLMADVIMSDAPVRATLLQLIGSEAHTGELKKLKNADLFAIFDLVYLQKQNIDEVMELVH